jgi:hypothetical protein
MAIARCQKHGPPTGRTRTFDPAPAEPIGYPDTAVVCGLVECREPGLVWLETQERASYRQGVRVFRIPSFAAKLRVN